MKSTVKSAKWFSWRRFFTVRHSISRKVLWHTTFFTKLIYTIWGIYIHWAFPLSTCFLLHNNSSKLPYKWVKTSDMFCFSFSSFIFPTASSCRSFFHVLISHVLNQRQWRILNYLPQLLFNSIIQHYRDTHGHIHMKAWLHSVK